MSKWKRATIQNCKGVEDILRELAASGADISRPLGYETAEQTLDRGEAVANDDDIWQRLPQVLAHGRYGAGVRASLEGILAECR